MHFPIPMKKLGRFVLSLAFLASGLSFVPSARAQNPAQADLDHVVAGKFQGSNFIITSLDVVHLRLEFRVVDQSR